jgi:4-amino-4-deoxy-L-arabinose transferase-like glycosyltransferase
MLKDKVKLTNGQSIAILGTIWLVSNLCDRLWLALDRSVPAWDQSNHLTHSLKYLRALQTPHFFDGHWWRSFWMLSSKYPPLTYILSAPFQQIFGVGSDYTLTATYLNRRTGESYPLAVPPVNLTIDPNAPVSPAPELDFVTQLRRLALNLPQGPKALEPVFEQVARLNQYDPVQDYLEQAAQTLEYRLTKMSTIVDKKLHWFYGLVLARVLQEDASSAIAALKSLVRLDPNNAYAHAYLAFVYLYDWQPQAAQKALQPALAIKPDDPEIQSLAGVAALMQGNFFKAWKILSAVL